MIQSIKELRMQGLVATGQRREKVYCDEGPASSLSAFEDNGTRGRLTKIENHCARVQSMSVPRR